MSDTAKFKLNTRTGEVEIEGPEAFVDRQIRQLEMILGLLVQPRTAPDRGGDTDEDEPLGENLDSPSGNASTNTALGTFGEWMHGFKRDINDLDKALITARYVQSQSSANDFKTSEVNGSLKDHGIKLANPSVCLKRLSERKYLFQTRKVGKLRFMRVSTEGQKHLDSLKVG